MAVPTTPLRSGTPWLPACSKFPLTLAKLLCQPAGGLDGNCPEVDMAASHERRVVDSTGMPTVSGSQTRRPWVKPDWQRLDTPMEVTMYVGRR